MGKVAMRFKRGNDGGKNVQGAEVEGTISVS